MEVPAKKRGRPRSAKVDNTNPKPEDLEEILQDIEDEVISDYEEYIPNEMPDYLIIKNRKNINNNEDVYDFDVEKEDGPGISNFTITYIYIKYCNESNIFYLHLKKIKNLRINLKANH